MVEMRIGQGAIARAAFADGGGRRRHEVGNQAVDEISQNRHDRAWRRDFGLERLDKHHPRKGRARDKAGIAILRAGVATGGWAAWRTRGAWWPGVGVPTMLSTTGESGVRDCAFADVVSAIPMVARKSLTWQVWSETFIAGSWRTLNSDIGFLERSVPRSLFFHARARHEAMMAAGKSEGLAIVAARNPPSARRTKWGRNAAMKRSAR